MKVLITEQIANNILEKIGYRFPVSLTEACKLESIAILALDGKEKYECWGTFDRKRKSIYLNLDEPPARQTFTIAHALGHYFLHDHIDTDILNRDAVYSDKPIELEANHFAACLLMPKDKFIQVFRALNGNINKIAKYFGVSRPAVAFRADIIGNVRNEFF